MSKIRYIVEHLKLDESNRAYWTIVACYDKLEYAIAYCANKDHEYYNIVSFVGEQFIINYEPDGKAYIE